MEWLDEVYGKIQAEVDNPRQYSHNIVSSILRRIDSRYGRAVANDMIETLDLEEVFDISPVPEED